MTRGITQNHWRFCEPEAPNLEYGCLPNKKVYVDLRQELTHGVRPPSSEVVATNRVQTGYFCDYVIDVPVSDGIVHQNDDGRGFWYVPTKNFIGTDKLSYRIINIMNQTSEPGCITFEVDYNQRPERTIIVPVLAKTTILQNADADYWVEDNESRKLKKVRTVFAYNTIPDSDYVLFLTGIWKANYMATNIYGIRYVATVAGSITQQVLNTKRTIDFADYDVLTFDAAIDDKTIGMPDFWPDFLPDGTTPIFSQVMNVGLKMAPIGDNRITAESSNLLAFGYDAFETFPREISEKTRARLANKSTYFAQLSHSVKQPVLFVNGHESICVTRSFKNNRSIDISGLTFDPIADANKLVAVVEQSYFDPLYNSATQNTIRSKSVPYTYNGFDNEAQVITLTFVVANIPISEDGVTQFALVADLPDLTSAFSIHGFAPEFLDKDSDGAFLQNTEYKGLLVLDTFEIPAFGRLVTVDDEKTAIFNITKKFCSNIEYINAQTTCLDAFGNVEFIPIDFSKVRGFVIVPYSNAKAGANKKMLSSTYIPVLASATNVYADISNTAQQVAFYGSVADKISPAINYPTELLKWKFTPKIAPDIVAFFVLENEAKLTAKWRLVPKPTTVLDDLALMQWCKNHRLNNKEQWEHDRAYFDEKTIAVYEKMAPLTNKKLHKSAYPDIISISRQTKYENVGEKTDNNNGTNAFLLVIDLERTDHDLSVEHTIELMTYDAITNTMANNSRVLFDSPVEKISLIYADIAVKDGAVSFVELQKSIDY